MTTLPKRRNRARESDHIIGATQTDPTNDGQASTFPLIVGVTGHRDIAPAARQRVADAVGTLLCNLKHRFGPDALYVLSALAQGADQLVAQLAVANGIKLITVLPMPLDEYRATMADDADALRQFEQLRKHAELELELPWITPPDQSRCDKLQYEQLGAVMSRYSHILLALWDGLQRWETLDASQRQESRGGTAHVVYLRANAEREAEGFRYSRLFADAASRLDIARGGPVLQIVTPRVKTGGGTANLAASQTHAGECIMLRVQACESQPVSAEELSGRSPPCKDNLVALFGKNGAHELSQIEQLNACIRSFSDPDRHTHRTQLEALRPKCSADLTGKSRALIEIMRQLQASADTAAQVYQRRLLGTAMNWRALHLSSIGALLCFAVLGPLAVALFSGYAHLLHEWWLMMLYLATLVGGFALYWVSQSGGWQNRFQDYRALAEAMRVQTAWALSGVPRAVSDHYLRMQRDELGWVQFALRGPALWAAALSLGLGQSARDLINECWIEAQRDYFVGPTGKAGRALGHSESYDAIESAKSNWIAWGMVLTALLTGVAFAPDPEATAAVWARDVLLLLIPTALTVGAGFAFYGHARAYEEHAHSYLAMGRIFARARREADSLNSPDDAEAYNRLIFDLGREALAENAEWLKDHRSRPIVHEVHI